MMKSLKMDIEDNDLFIKVNYYAINFIEGMNLYMHCYYD
jgi:hypothetical protein